MNFLDTAITLLMETGRPMAVEELCKLALDKGLLDKPGANPLRSMKTRMTVELKRGDESRLQRSEDDIWAVCEGVERPEGAPPPAAKSKPAARTAKVSTAKAPKIAKAKVTKEKVTKEKVTKEKAAKVAKAKAPKDAKEQASAKAAAPKAAKTARASKSTKAKADEAKVAAAAADVEASEALESAELQSHEIEVEEPVPPPVELTPEEQALLELYSADSQGTRSAAELNEYQDELTSDEDRLMLPEIRAERHRPRPQERERGRKRRRGRPDRPERSESSEARDRSRDRDRDRPRDHERPRDRIPSSSHRPVLNGGARDIAGTPIQVMDVQGDASAVLTRSALKVLSVLPTGQTMPVRQLTQTLLRDRHIEGQADQMWRMVKGVLLVSEQRRRARGLHPLVRYHGKDLFSAGPDLGRSVVDMASAALSVAAENYAAAVEGEMLARLSHLAPQMLERIAYVYLQESGWTDITWLKRVDQSSYAVATAPGAVDETLVSVRSGPNEVDRRGVGELRAGLHAKDLSSGFLISPCELSDEADTELAQDGRHIRVLCGRPWIAELCSREVGVSWRHIQLPQIDQRFWDAVLS